MLHRSRLLILAAGIGLFLLLFLGAMLNANAEVTDQEPIGLSLPDAPTFAMTTTSGDVFDLAEIATTKTVVLEWTNHDCPFVVKHYAQPPANMQTLQARDDADSVVWVSIVSSAPGQQGHITAEKSAELTTSRGAKPDFVILDETGEIGRLYGAKTTPHMFIIENVKDSKKIAYQGAIDSVRSARVRDIAKAENYVANALDAVASGAMPQPFHTKPYGCPVKYTK